jgi:V8-like Glu-specific endopeptidase
LITRLVNHFYLGAIAALTIIGTATPSSAQDFKFSARSYDRLLLVPNQSTGGNAALMAAQEGGAFEPLSEFNSDDRYRQFGGPVARLVMLIQGKDGNQHVSVCTANLVAPDIVLTNYHCIPGMEPGDKVVKAKANFDYLREDQEDTPTYEVDINPIAADSDKDFALLRVAGRPGDTFGYFKLKPRKAKPNQSLFIIHHPAGMPKRLTRFRCKAYAPKPYADIFFRHRCDTLGGSSGSLIFDLNFEVVALHNLGGLHKDSSTSFNSGISIYSLMQDPKILGLIQQATPNAPPDAPLMSPNDLSARSDANAPKVGNGSVISALLAAQNPPANDAPQPSPPGNTPTLKLSDGFSLYKNNPPAITHLPLPQNSDTYCDNNASGRICASSMLSPKGAGNMTIA